MPSSINSIFHFFCPIGEFYDCARSNLLVAHSYSLGDFSFGLVWLCQKLSYGAKKVEHRALSEEMMQACGVIVGANERYAWLLPWWWRHYARHNAYPVTFVDFGLSEEVLAWCRERGEVIQLDPQIESAFLKEAVDPVQAHEWEALHGKEIWNVRKCFLYKPIAFQHSPYEVSLWLDLDCEVCGSLHPLFAGMKSTTEMALSVFPDRPGTYSSGAIVFRRESKMLRDWVELCQSHGARMMEEDSILSWLVQTGKYSIQVLPPAYHTIGLSSFQTAGLIVHWNGNLGKLFIEMHGGYQDYKEFLLRGGI